MIKKNAAYEAGPNVCTEMPRAIGTVDRRCAQVRRKFLLAAAQFIFFIFLASMCKQHLGICYNDNAESH